jgi:hypothetical protein
MENDAASEAAVGPAVVPAEAGGAVDGVVPDADIARDATSKPHPPVADASTRSAARPTASPPATHADAAVLEDPGENGWPPRRHPCVQGPNGQMICPPYGCVFPDEACDVVRA